MKKIKTQRFYYKGTEFQYRIAEPALRRYKHETGKSILVEISKESSKIIEVLYYTVCWEGATVSLKEFVRDWKTGRVNLLNGGKGYSLLEIYKLLKRSVRRFKLEN